MDQHATPFSTGSLLVADIVGVGVLALPYAVSKLGVTLGFLLLGLCTVVNVTAGWAIDRLTAEDKYPGACTLADIAAASLGRVTHL